MKIDVMKVYGAESAPAGVKEKNANIGCAAASSAAKTKAVAAIM